MFQDYVTLKPQVEAGNVRPLAVAGTKRSKFIPRGADDNWVGLQRLRSRNLGPACSSLPIRPRLLSRRWQTRCPKLRSTRSMSKRWPHSATHPATCRKKSSRHWCAANPALVDVDPQGGYHDRMILRGCG